MKNNNTTLSRANTSRSDMNSAASDDEDFDFDDDNQVDLDEIGEVASDVDDDMESHDSLEPTQM